MYNVKIVFQEKDKINNYVFPEEVNIIMLSEMGKTRKKALSTKSYFGARETPFCIIYKEENLLKAFYKEASDDPIQEAIDYIIFDIDEGLKNQSKQ